MLHGTGPIILIIVILARIALQRGIKRRPRHRDPDRDDTERRGWDRSDADRSEPEREGAVRPHRAPVSRRGPVALVLHQARYDLLALLRNRQARYATVLLPLLLLVLLTSVFGDDRSTSYVPGLAALAVIASSFVNLVISVVTQRETGVLKRRRATPVPAWALIAGRTLTATAVAAAVTTVLVAVGRFAFGVRFPATAIPEIAATVLAGAVCFCILGYALTTAIRSSDAAQPTLQALMLPLYLASGIFIPAADLPSGLWRLAELFPVEHLADALRQAFGSALAWSDLGILALWAAAGLAIAMRRFSWSPTAAV